MNDLCSAWNPGLESDIPPAYRKLETIYRPENVTTSLDEVAELLALTGLSAEELVVFRPERLALHELIVRVTADILVLEGEDETELGRNFRRIAGRILRRYIQPRMGELTRTYDQLRETASSRIRRELDETLFKIPTPEPARKGLFRSLGSKRRRPAKPGAETTLERERRAIAAFKEQGLAAPDPLSAAVYQSLYRVLGSIAASRGYLGPDPDLLTSLVCNRVCNTRGSTLIGETMTPWIAEAIEGEGYPTVGNADKPLLISLKGASAAGKSSLRPMLKRIMSEKGVVAEGYATISPDIWRRLLLDYEALGEAYKYAGRLTGHELIAIDGKLDRYIRGKAEQQGAIPHMLVDRFRFDSFSSERIAKVLHGTYVQHVDTMYMYFVVTPPHETVTRGWERGLRTGRYKAVEDYLDHSVEAYSGMPRILFKWLAYGRPLYKYEFLDNSVPKGTFPKTIARGTQDEINIFDCSGFVDIERYQKINIRARTPDDVYPEGPQASVANNVAFLRQCIRKIPAVNFIDRATGKAYVSVRQGAFSIIDRDILAAQLRDTERAQIFAALAPQLCAAT
jgi:hypothetical protein